MASHPSHAPIAALLPASVEWRGEGYPGVSDPIPGIAKALEYNAEPSYVALQVGGLQVEGAALRNDAFQHRLIAQLTESLILMSDHHSRGRDFPYNAADCMEWTASVEIMFDSVTVPNGLSLQREIVRRLELLCSVVSKIRVGDKREIHWTFSGFAEDVMHAAYAGRLFTPPRILRMNDRQSRPC